MKTTPPAAFPPEASTNVTKSPPDLQEHIRVRAYGLYEQRGKEGHELENWLQAESEVNQQRAKTLGE